MNKYLSDCAAKAVMVLAAIAILLVVIFDGYVYLMIEPQLELAKQGCRDAGGMPLHIDKEVFCVNRDALIKHTVIK
jgi:hypothetical protein